MWICRGNDDSNECPFFPLFCVLLTVNPIGIILLTACVLSVFYLIYFSDNPFYGLLAFSCFWEPLDITGENQYCFSIFIQIGVPGMLKKWEWPFVRAGDVWTVWGQSFQLLKFGRERYKQAFSFIPKLVDNLCMVVMCQGIAGLTEKMQDKRNHEYKHWPKYLGAENIHQWVLKFSNKLEYCFCSCHQGNKNKKRNILHLLKIKARIFCL